MAPPGPSRNPLRTQQGHQAAPRIIATKAPRLHQITSSLDTLDLEVRDNLTSLIDSDRYLNELFKSLARDQEVLGNLARRLSKSSLAREAFDVPDWAKHGELLVKVGMKIGSVVETVLRRGGVGDDGDDEDVFMDTDDSSEVTAKPLCRIHHVTAEGGGMGMRCASSDTPDISWRRGPGCGCHADDADREYLVPVTPAYDSATAEWCSSGYESEHDEDDGEVCTPESQHNYGSPHTGCSQTLEDAHLVDTDGTLSDIESDGALIQDSPSYSQSTQRARMDEEHLQPPLKHNFVLQAAAAQVMDQGKPPKIVGGFDRMSEDIAREADGQRDGGKSGKHVWNQPSPPTYSQAKLDAGEKNVQPKHHASVEEDMENSEAACVQKGVSLVPDTVVPSIEVTETAVPATLPCEPGANARGAYPTPRLTPPNTASSTVRAAPCANTFFFSPLSGTVAPRSRARQASSDARHPVDDRMRRSEGPSPSPNTPPPSFGAERFPPHPSNPYYTSLPHTQPSFCTTFTQSGSYTSPYGPASSYTQPAACGTQSRGVFSLAPSLYPHTPNPFKGTPSPSMYAKATQHSTSAGFSDRRTQMAKKYPTPKRKVPAEGEMLTGFERLKKRRANLEMRMSEVSMGEVFESGVNGVPSVPDGGFDLRIEGGIIDDRLLEGGAEFVICEDETATEPHDSNSLA